MWQAEITLDNLPLAQAVALLLQSKFSERWPQIRALWYLQDGKPVLILQSSKPIPDQETVFITQAVLELGQQLMAVCAEVGKSIALAPLAPE